MTLSEKSATFRGHALAVPHHHAVESPERGFEHSHQAAAGDERETQEQEREHPRHLTQVAPGRLARSRSVVVHPGGPGASHLKIHAFGGFFEVVPIEAIKATEGVNELNCRTPLGAQTMTGAKVDGQQLKRSRSLSTQLDAGA